MLNKFYAVTLNPKSGHTALFQIIINKNNVVATKISHNSKGQCDIKIGDSLTGGSILGILYSNCGLVMFNRDSKSSRPDLVSTVNWKDRTSPLVCLTGFKSEAEKCLNASDLKYWDKRFVGYSIEVVAALGQIEKECPYIRLCAKLSEACDHANMNEVIKEQK